jgi:hypothetical protein
LRGRLEGELELEGVILAVGLGSGWICGGCGGALGWCVGFLGLKGAWWRLGGRAEALDYFFGLGLMRVFG